MAWGSLRRRPSDGRREGGDSGRRAHDRRLLAHRRREGDGNWGIDSRGLHPLGSGGGGRDRLEAAGYRVRSIFTRSELVEAPAVASPKPV